jgi:alpha-methylacyl-CoA racemase
MTQASGPLAGIRVVEFDAIGPAPMAAMLLADLGCDIVRISRPLDQPSLSDVGASIMHRNRRHVRLDLRDPAGRDQALALVERADAVIEGFRPGVMERLGLGPDICQARHPALVYVRMTGWGQTGPLAARAGHDINYIALTGNLHAVGQGAEPPVPPLNLVGDYGGGAMFAVTGLLSGLIAARRDGRGPVVDVAMTDGTAALTSIFHALRAEGHWSNGRGENLLDGSRPFYRCYRCADGAFVAVGALEPQFFALLLNGLGIPADQFSQYDPAGWPAMTATFEAAFATRSRDDWATVFQDTDACVAPVLSFAEAATHPHNLARRTYVEAEGVTQPAAAPRFSNSTAVIDPARRGELTVAAVLDDWADSPYR